MIGINALYAERWVNIQGINLNTLSHEGGIFIKNLKIRCYFPNLLFLLEKSSIAATNSSFFSSGQKESMKASSEYAD